MVKEKLKSWRSLEEYFTTIERPLKINCGIVHLRICFLESTELTLVV